MWNLSRRWRQATLIVHLISAGAWIGVDVIVAVLVLTGWFGGDVQTRSLAYQALATFVVWPMLTSALVCLATGLVLGLGSKWGLVRYWWVLVKLGLNLLMCALIVTLLAPGMPEVATYGRELLTGAPDPVTVSQLFYPPAVSLSMLTFAVVLGVVKPWGRIAKSRDRAPRTRVADEVGVA